MSFSGGGSVAALKSGGDKSGRLYLTTHRMIFNNKKEDLLKSFSFPFVALRDVELEQPIFGANYIKGKVVAQPDGGFQVCILVSNRSYVLTRPTQRMEFFILALYKYIVFCTETILYFLVYNREKSNSSYTSSLEER